MRTLPLVLLLLMAGCTAPADGPGLDLVAEEQGRPTAERPIPDGFVARRGVSEFNASLESHPGGAILFEFDFKPGECDVFASVQGDGADMGMGLLLVYDGVPMGGPFHIRSLVHADYGPVQTGGSGVRVVGLTYDNDRVSLDGNIQIVFVAGHYGRDNETGLAVNIQCDRPFDVVGATYGPEAAVVMAHDMDADGKIYVGWQAGYFDKAAWSHNFTAPYVAWHGDFDNGAFPQSAATVSWTTPGGEYDLAGGGHGAEGPGGYTLAVDGIGALDAWVVVWTATQPLAFDEVGRLP